MYLAACEICGEKPARYKCSICGREVCEDHYNSEKGVCSVCDELMIYYEGKYRPAVDVCPFCGRLICRECSIELQPGIRVCLDCYRKLNDYFKRYPLLRDCYSKYLRYKKHMSQGIKA